MKLQFLIPEDRITMLQDITIKSTGYGSDKYELKVGDVLEVSQIYIRKGGWYESSITFKPISGNVLQRKLESRAKEIQKYIGHYRKQLKSQMKQLAELESGTLLGTHHKTLYIDSHYQSHFRGVCPVQVMGPVDTNRFKPYIYTQAIIDQEIQYLKDRIAEQEREIANCQRDQLKKKTTEVIRILLSDVEQFDVDITRAPKTKKKK